jgi:hypothetical protein
MSYFPMISIDPYVSKPGEKTRSRKSTRPLSLVVHAHRET